MASESKTYLGDGLYADFDGYQIVLTAEDGISVTNVVYLDPHVLSSFMHFLEDKTPYGQRQEET